MGNVVYTDGMFSKSRKTDKELLEQLYYDYYKALVNYSMQITGELQTSQDIVQDVFTRIIELSVDMDNDFGIKSYLYNSVRNLSFNYLRKKGAERNYIKHLAEQYEEFHATDSGDEDFFKEEIYRMMFKIIDGLPERQREVFLMCLEGKKCREIAEALSLSIATVKVHRHRSLAKLRKELGDKGLVLVLLLLSN